LFLGGVGLGNIGLIAAITVSTLAAESVSRTATWSGLPSALSILGTALGSTLLATAMQRWGRRNGLVCGYSLAALGAGLAVVALVQGSLALLVGSMFIIGLGRSGDAMSRYLVADLYPLDRRATALSWVVWMGTVGAVVGPNSLGPAGRVAVHFGLPQLSGAYLVTVCAYGVVATGYTLFLRPDPATLVVEEDRPEESEEPVPFRRLFLRSNVRVALAVLIVGQTVMVLIMTMTPLYLKISGHGLGAVGVVMSSHIVGMFVLSPVTGRLVDRWGRLRVIVVGLTTLLVATISAVLAPASEVKLIALALFLLGLGWNLGFVAGSALLGSGIDIRQRARLQGVTDSMIWTSAATASAFSGVVLAGLGYDALCVIGALLLLIPVTVMLWYWEAVKQ
jgi:MFS family permease